MFRNAAVRATQLSSRRFQSTASSPVLAQVEQTYVKLPKEQQLEVLARLNEVMKADWNKVSIEDKRAVYYATYGPHNRRRPHTKPGDNMKIFVGVVATIAVSLTISSLVRSSVPKPRTLTKEWQEASNEFAREHNINPISGVSSEGYKGKGFVQHD
ncbi:cytochrome c oxidase [Coemansia sp. Benny D115]|nr:cytochrome c oxidase [Coemansia sp. Benny D115]